MNNYYDKKLQELIDKLSYSKLEALAEISHIYLDNKPKEHSKDKRDEEFWNSQTLKEYKNEFFQLDTYYLTLIKNFQSEKLYQIDFITDSNTSAIKQAIKASKIFLNEDNKNYKKLKNVLNIEFKEFFNDCDAIAKQYKELKQEVENQKETLIEFAYVDVLFLMSFSSLKYAEVNYKNPVYFSFYNIVMTKILEDRVNKRDRKKRKIDEKYILRKEMEYFQIKEILTFKTPFLSSKYEIFHVIFDVYAQLLFFQQNQLFSFIYDENFEVDLNQDIKYNTSELVHEKLQVMWTFYEEYSRTYVSKNEFEKVYRERGNNLSNLEINYKQEIIVLRTKLIMKEIYGLEEDIFIDDSNKLNLKQLISTGATFSTLYEFEYIMKYLPVLERNGINNFWNSYLEIHKDGARHDKKRMPLVNKTIKEEVKLFNRDFNIELSDKLLDFWVLDIKEKQTKYPNLYEKPFIKIDDYIFIFPWMIAFNSSPMIFINSLLRVHTNRMESLENGKKNNVRKEEVSRSEKNLADKFSKFGFKVKDGYNHSKSEDYGVQDMDIVAFKDGHLFILELKSTYERDGLKSNWIYKTRTLRKAGNQLLKRKRYVEKLLKEKDHEFIEEFGDVKKIHTWIVDTSFQFDHEYFSNSLKISMFELIHALSDNILEGFYPHGFNTETFIKNIESGKLFENIEEDFKSERI